LKRNRLPRTARQDIGAETDADGCIGGSTHITALKRAFRTNARSPYGPGDAATIDEADIDAEFSDGAGVMLNRAATAGRPEYAIHILLAADDDADSRGDVAGQHTDFRARLGATRSGRSYEVGCESWSRNRNAGYHGHCRKEGSRETERHVFVLF